MIEILGMLAIVAILAVMLIIAVSMKKNPNIKLCVAEGDEDVKIAPGLAGDEDVKIAGGQFSEEISNEDHADKAAKEFLYQRRVGNIDVAGQCGELLAKSLWDTAQDLIMNEDPNLSDKEVHQRILLMSFAINVVISEHTPSPLLAETALSVFYNEVEELSSVLYRHVSDVPAFSLYILNMRKGVVKEDVGRIYAKLIEHEGDPAKIREGINIYSIYYRKWIDLCNKEIIYND